jgi:hypothetical protein
MIAYRFSRLQTKSAVIAFLRGYRQSAVLSDGKTAFMACWNIGRWLDDAKKAPTRLSTNRGLLI